MMERSSPATTLMQAGATIADLQPHVAALAGLAGTDLLEAGTHLVSEEGAILRSHTRYKLHQSFPCQCLSTRSGKQRRAAPLSRLLAKTANSTWALFYCSSVALPGLINNRAISLMHFTGLFLTGLFGLSMSRCLDRDLRSLTPPDRSLIALPAFGIPASLAFGSVLSGSSCGAR